MSSRERKTSSGPLQMTSCLEAKLPGLAPLEDLFDHVNRTAAADLSGADGEQSPVAVRHRHESIEKRIFGVARLEARCGPEVVRPCDSHQGGKSHTLTAGIRQGGGSAALTPPCARASVRHVDAPSPRHPYRRREHARELCRQDSAVSHRMLVGPWAEDLRASLPLITDAF